MVQSRGLAAPAAGARLEPFAFERRDPGPEDVLLRLTHCGICHSDLHYVLDEWKSSRFPLVPGHEAVGVVEAVGAAVTGLAVGDVAGIGCLVGSCRECDACMANQEQECRRAVPTYGVDRSTGETVYGGYSDSYVVDQHFALRMPPGLDPARTAPLLCAGITTYSPLRHWEVGEGIEVGVVGLGGLGHMGVKLAKALGARVTVLTTSPAKAEDARRLGADDVVVSTSRDDLRRVRRRLDFVLDTVSASHDLDALLGLLRRDGTLCLVGIPPDPQPLSAGSLVRGRRRLAGSAIGGVAETQEMLDFCATHDVLADVEVIGVQDVDLAYERLRRGDVRYRFVLDLSTLG